MKAVCTYCSGPKRTDDGLLPARDRYMSARIRDLEAAAARDGRLFLILSGEFGLIRAGAPIPWYDHLLRPDESGALAPRVAEQMRALEISALAYHTADPESVPAVRPYLETLRAACAATETPLEVVILAGDPP